MPRSEVVKPAFPRPQQLNLSILPGMFDFEEDEGEAERKFNEGN
jgi:hypothetical protein